MRTRETCGTYRYWIVYDLRPPRPRRVPSRMRGKPDPWHHFADLGTTKPRSRAHQTSGGAPGISPDRNIMTRGPRAWTPVHLRQRPPSPEHVSLQTTCRTAVVHHVAPAQLYACCAPLRRPGVSSSVAPSRGTLAATSGVLCRRGAARCATAASSRSRFARRGGGGVVVRRAASSPPPFA